MATHTQACPYQGAKNSTSHMSWLLSTTSLKFLSVSWTTSSLSPPPPPPEWPWLSWWAQRGSWYIYMYLSPPLDAKFKTILVYCRAQQMYKANLHTCTCMFTTQFIEMICVINILWTHTLYMYHCSTHSVACRGRRGRVGYYLYPEGGGSRRWVV